MDKTLISFETAIRRWVEEQRGGLADALPDPKEMVACREGRLDPEAEAALQERLALLPAAAREFLDLAEFERLQPPDDSYRLSDREVQDALVAMRARIRQEEEQEAKVIPFPAKRLRRLRTIAWLSAAAAVLAVVVGGSWIGSLYRQLDERAGSGFAQVIDLHTTRGARTFTVHPDTKHILLIFHDVDLRSFPRGRLAVSTTGGAVLHQDDFEAPRDEESLLRLEFLRDLLPDGTYRFEVFGLDSEGRHLLKEYLLALETK